MNTETIIKRGWFKDWAGQRVAYQLVESLDVFGKPYIEARVNPYGDGWHSMGGGGRSCTVAKDEAIKAWNRFDIERF